MPAASHYILKSDRYSSHAQIADWLIRNCLRMGLSRECAVLDVRCAQCFLGNWLSASDFYLMGVDNNPTVLDDVHPNYRLAILTDIEALPQFKIDRRPDALVVADVLEHCRDAVSVLRALCAKSAIHIERVATTPAPLPLIHASFGEGRALHGLHPINAWSARMLKQLLAYQFIFFGRYQPPSAHDG